MNWVGFSTTRHKRDETKYIFTGIRGFEYFQGIVTGIEGNDYTIAVFQLNYLASIVESAPILMMMSHTDSKRTFIKRSIYL